jgi:hypothetical protein
MGRYENDVWDLAVRSTQGTKATTNNLTIHICSYCLFFKKRKRLSFQCFIHCSHYDIYIITSVELLCIKDRQRTEPYAVDRELG